MSQLIRTTSLMGYIDLVKELGGDPGFFLRQQLLDPEKVRKLEGVISHSAMVYLLEATAKALDCPDFGLKLSSRQDLMILGPLAVIALNSPTVGEALDQIAKYMHYFAPGVRVTVEREVEPGLSRMSFEQNIQMQQNMDLTLGVALNAVRMLYRKSFRPEKVLFKGNPPLSDTRYQEHFSAPICRQSRYYALILPTQILDAPIDKCDPKIHDMLEEFVQDALENEPLTIPAQVESLIVQLLPTHCCDLKNVASRLGLQPRTLQRQLAGESESFEQMLDRIRRHHANKYLAESKMRMAQIASLLGYRDQSAFNRACRRWFDTNPAGRRKQLLHAS